MYDLNNTVTCRWNDNILSYYEIFEIDFAISFVTKSFSDIRDHSLKRCYSTYKCEHEDVCLKNVLHVESTRERDYEVYSQPSIPAFVALQADQNSCVLKPQPSSSPNDPNATDPPTDHGKRFSNVKADITWKIIKNDFNFKNSMLQSRLSKASPRARFNIST